MGYFKELEIDVIDLLMAEVPAEEIADMVGISVELVNKIAVKYENDSDPQVMDYA